MDFSTLFEIAVAGVPLVLVILGLVEWVKSMGVTGKPLTALSMTLGLVLGGGYQLTQGVPVNWNGWFTVIVFGLAYGLVASGIYKVMKQTSTKGAADSLGYEPKSRG